MRFQVLAVAASIAFSSANLVTFAETPPGSAAMAEEGHKHGEGEKHKLGRQKIGNYTVSVIMIGEAKPGAEVEFDIKLIDATSDPKSLRVWIGAEDGKGSEKTEAKKGEKTYDADVKVPSPLPEGAKVWVEVESDGVTARGSYALEEKHDHKH